MLPNQHPSAIKLKAISPYLKEIRVRKSKAGIVPPKIHSTLSQPAIKYNFIQFQNSNTPKNNNHTAVVHNFRQRSQIFRDEQDKKFFNEKQLEQEQNAIKNNQSTSIHQRTNKHNNLMYKHKEQLHRKHKFYIQKQLESKSIKSTRSISNLNNTKTPPKIPHIKNNSQKCIIKIIDTENAPVIKNKKPKFREAKYTNRQQYYKFITEHNQSQQQYDNLERYVPRKIKEIELSLEKSAEKYTKQNSYKEIKSHQEIAMYINTVKNPSLQKITTNHSKKKKKTQLINKDIYAYDFQFTDEPIRRKKQQENARLQQINPTFGLRQVLEKMVKYQSSDES